MAFSFLKLPFAKSSVAFGFYETAMKKDEYPSLGEYDEDIVW